MHGHENMPFGTAKLLKPSLTPSGCSGPQCGPVLVPPSSSTGTLRDSLSSQCSSLSCSILQGSHQQPPQEQPVPAQFKQQNTVVYITYLAERLQTSPAARAMSEATRRESITWPALYPQPRHRAWFHVMSGLRSGWGDKGWPWSRQWSCAPCAGSCC